MNYFVNINIIIIMNLEWMNNGFALIYFNNIVNKNEWIELEFGMEVVVYVFIYACFEAGISPSLAQLVER